MSASSAARPSSTQSTTKPSWRKPLRTLAPIIGSSSARRTRNAGAPCSLAVELERGRVHAVAQARRSRPVVEDVTEMRIARRAQYFSALHEEAPVLLGAKVLLGHRRIEARPAAAGVELGRRVEQRRAAAYARVGSGLFGGPVLAAEGCFGPLLPCHAVLLRRELLLPFGVGLRHFYRHESLLLSAGARQHL